MLIHLQPPSAPSSFSNLSPLSTEISTAGLPLCGVPMEQLTRLSLTDLCPAVRARQLGEYTTAWAALRLRPHSRDSQIREHGALLNQVLLLGHPCGPLPNLLGIHVCSCTGGNKRKTVFIPKWHFQSGLRRTARFGRTSMMNVPLCVSEMMKVAPPWMLGRDNDGQQGAGGAGEG
ncbi:hypothetical protein ElyMa_006575700 [Elysia marginata]|uniref:Uncharacterized protein n=1 Tax=Elysia marginata TaxID=1093978 RepID=A0AAV4IGJ2_9GAST|nr:hypothetical protein ElyMa_006575700 [Elysia marginata]